MSGLQEFGPKCQYRDLSQVHSAKHARNDMASGTIFMKSKSEDLVLPITFTLNGRCPELSTEFPVAVQLVTRNIIQSHTNNPGRWPPFEQNQEILRVPDTELSLSLVLLAGNTMNVSDFKDLAGLVEGTTLRLFQATQYSAFETAWLRGEYRKVSFQAWWTLYSSIGGGVGRCERPANRADNKEM